MGKPTGFMEWARRSLDKRDANTRVRDALELYTPRDPEESKRQGGRCMDCGIPFCHQGCPLGNNIPDFNDAIYQDRWREAYRVLSATNNFPEFTGRLCPAPCEAACVLGLQESPVTIENNELEVIERAWAEGWVEPKPPKTRSGQTVAVVGSGPAGLAAAAQLNQAGHQVTVYEAADRVGGLLRYGIPDFKLDKRFIERRVALMEAEGVRFVTNTPVGTSPTWEQLKADHDGLVIATGARRPRDLPVPGRELPGVHYAMDFLTRQNKLVAGDENHATELDAQGKKVIVIGGGDTGADCVGTSHRQRAASVLQIELMPRPPETRAEDNPWPQWPLVLRTSTSHEEGGQREWAVMTKRFLGEEKLSGIETVQVDVQREGGRLRFVERPGTETILEADLVLLAIGFTGPDTAQLTEQLGVELDQRGNVKTDEAFATNVPGVYCAGDAHRGQSLIVWAISEGREAARALDAQLRGAPSTLPTKGVSLHFGGR